MTRRYVEIDDQLLARAQAILGEPTISDTVTAALKKLANDELRQQHMAYLRDPDNAVDPAILDELRDPWRKFPGGRPPDDDDEE